MLIQNKLTVMRRPRSGLMTAQERHNTGTEAKLKKRRKAMYALVMILLVAVPALLLLHRIAGLAGPYLSQPTGVIVKTDFLEQRPDYYIYDDVIGHVHRPGAQVEVLWDEHPTGRVLMRTNNMGFREDGDTDPKKGDDTVRILVTGDSHIDGVVDNSESFPNRLEALLNESGGIPKFEVINGGTGYYGPHHYSKFIDKYQSLAPDAFIVVIYSGNDFLDAVRSESDQDSAVAAGRDLGTWKRMVYFGRLATARRISHGATSQGLNQAFFFKRFPKLKEVSLKVTKREIGKMRDRCRSTGTDLYMVLLPVHWDMEETDMGWSFKMSRLVLGLSRSDLAVAREFTDSLAMWLDRNGIDYIRLADCAYGDPDRPLFWRSDCHLNVNGHGVLAEEVSRAFDWSYDR
jgi:hypothetical protein